MEGRILCLWRWYLYIVVKYNKTMKLKALCAENDMIQITTSIVPGVSNYQWGSAADSAPPPGIKPPSEIPSVLCSVWARVVVMLVGCVPLASNSRGSPLQVLKSRWTGVASKTKTTDAKSSQSMTDAKSSQTRWTRVDASVMALLIRNK